MWGFLVRVFFFSFEKGVKFIFNVFTLLATSKTTVSITAKEALMHSELLGLCGDEEERWHIDLFGLFFFQIFFFLPLNFHHLYFLCVGSISG